MSITISIGQTTLTVIAILVWVFITTILTGKQAELLDKVGDNVALTFLWFLILLTMPIYLVVVITKQVFIKEWK